MIRLIQRRLIIPRGDTGTFTVPLLATAQTGDVSVFTIFDQKTQKKVFEKIVTIEGEALQIEFSHADTVNLPVGDYVWDIKFYKDPIIVDDKLIDGTEIDSYYAAFKLPVCEIRQTGDTLLTADDAPTTTIEPNTLNVLTAAMEVTSQNKASVEQAAATVAEDLEEVEGLAAQVRENAEVAGDAATNASESASPAGEALADTIRAKNDAIAANTAAQQALTNVNAAATNATIKATEANASAAAASNSASAASSSASEAATSASNAAASVTEMEALVRAIPTNVSEFENDAGYITAAALPTKVSDLTDDSGHYTKPAGGIPASDLAETYLTEHQDISGKAEKSEIPTKVSQLQNDSGYLTSFTEIDPTVPAWAKAAQKPSYTAAEVGAPTVQEMNSAISTAIGNVNSFDMAVVQELPATDISTHTIYLVPKTGETNDVYDEYVYINNAWEMVGNTQIDLSNYVQKTDYATLSTAGVVKAMSNGSNATGIGVNANGLLTTMPALDQNIKNSSGSYAPIVPVLQHFSTFYGLAKAAGDTTQSASSNAVGTYTDEAKAAIQQMLGVSSAADVSNKADKADTVLDTTLSRGRKANTTVGIASIAFGVDAEASGYYSTAIGLNTSAVSQGAFAEGKNTVARYIAHAEGEDTQALGQWAHSQGVGTVAKGAASFAGGDNTIANGHSSFVTGKYNVADSYDDWAFWAANTSYNVGDKVKREQLVNSEPTIIGYICKEANTDATFDISHWDFDSNHMNYSVIVGNGYEAEDSETHETVRHGSNAYALDWDGNGYYKGDVYVHSNAYSTGGTKLATVNDIAVDDVQVNGVSVVSDGVANVPKASSSVIGVVSIGNGLMINQNGAVSVEKAIDANIKAGTHQYLPIVPYNQHSAAFYGLAKAAGADMAQSSNAIGTYTDAAKTAIKNMIGVEEGLKVVRLI